MRTQIAYDTLCNDRCKAQLDVWHTCTAQFHIGIHRFASVYSDVSTSGLAIESHLAIIIHDFSQPRTTPLGHEQPYNIVAILACERLLPNQSNPWGPLSASCFPPTAVIEKNWL